MHNKNYYPVIILLLIAALVAVSSLLVLKRAKNYQSATHTLNANEQNQKIYEWKMVTSWPKNFPGLGTAPERFAENVKRMSNGRLNIKIFGGGELVPPLGVFDAVSLGTVEMGHSGAYYWKGKIASSPFFTAVPFGMNAQQMNAWLYYGGGLELWREAYAPFNVVPMAGGNTGIQMAGWFNTKINSIDDIKGLKMRIPGVGGEVFKQVGGVAVNVPGGEIYTSLKTGVLDATEWVSPYNDLALGLHQVASYYYYPGWHEPGPTLELIVNKDALAALPQDLQTIVEVAARAMNQDMLDEYTARNNQALQQLIDEYNVTLLKLPDDVIEALREASESYLNNLAKSDPFNKKVYDSWKDFADKAKQYNKISEGAYSKLFE